jgi:tetratricopeptide (TPR) repeat protein
MEVVFYPVVKNLSVLQIMKKVTAAYAVMLCCAGPLILAEPAFAKGIHMGGSDTSTRIIFDLKIPASPEISQKDRTLIVNFPDTVADPQTLPGRFMIENLTFNGKAATITVREPFSYKVSSEVFPPRFIIDLAPAKKTAVSADTCPIRNIDASTSKNVVRVTLSVGAEKLPKVRTSKNGRIFLQFSEELTCHEVSRLASAIPQIQFGGILKMQEGSALCFSLTEKNTLLDVSTDNRNGKIVFEIDTSGSFTPELRYNMAWNFYELGNIASVVSTLESSRKTLSAKEKILLARAYWVSAYPYRMKTSAKALDLMNEALQSMSPGMEREQVLLEYSSMLMTSGQAVKASEYIKFLKDSAWDDIALEASIGDIDILNRKKAFQDAYVASKRLTRDLGQNGIPAKLKAYFLTIQGDTYLGLNDNPKALSYYQEALAADPSYMKKDLGLASRMAQAALNMNEFAQAKDYVLQSINLGDSLNRDKNLLMLGDCLHQLGERNKAIVVFSLVENTSSKGDNRVVAQLKKAKLMLEKDTDERGKVSNKTFHRVMKIYEELEAAENFSDPSLAYLVKIRIAQAFAKHGDWNLALDTYLKVWQDTKPADPIHKFAQTEASGILSQRFRLFFTNSQYDKVYELHTRYQSNFMKEMRDPEVLFMVGLSLCRAGHPDMARPVLVSSLDEDSTFKDQALLLLFTIDTKRGDYVEALKWNTMYLNAYPKGKDAELMKEKQGEILYLMGRLKEALPYLEASAAKGGEQSLTFLSYLADTYRGLGMEAKQIQTLDRIISYRGSFTSPAIEEALYLRAHQLKRSGELLKAKSLYQELLSAYPGSKHAYWAMYYTANIETALGNYPEAKGLLTNVTRLSKDPILLSAARVAANDMYLKKDLEDYGLLKGNLKGE